MEAGKAKILKALAGDLVFAEDLFPTDGMSGSPQKMEGERQIGAAWLLHPLVSITSQGLSQHTTVRARFQCGLGGTWAYTP